MADGDYERRDARAVELKRLERLIRENRVAVRRETPPTKVNEQR